MVDALLFGWRLACLFGFCGALFALGFGGVCKLLKWSPVNITIKTFVHHVNDRDGGRP